MISFFSFLTGCFISFFSFSQSQYLVKGEMYSAGSSYLFLTVDTVKCLTESNSGFRSSGKFYYIIGDSSCTNKISKWYVLFHDKKIVFAEKYFFRETKKLDSLLSIIKRSFPNIHERAKVASAVIVQIEAEEKRQVEEADKQAELTAIDQEKKDKKEIDSLNKEFEKSLNILRTKSIVLYNWSWSYPNEYSRSAEVSITVINPYKQKIKYLWFTFTAKNPVGDPIRDGISGKTETTVQGIGPIEYSAKGSYQFENVFYSKVIETIKIKQIKIQFFDGSVKVLSNPVSLNKEDE